jgi:predicted phosphoadenosine phosphosulfate sulfurtransferase
VRILKRKETERDVLTAARERFDTIFKRFDRVVISFSGGKDSTVCLLLALEAAERYDRLPLDVMFWDEEAIHPPTIEYVDRVRNDKRVELRWICEQIEHRNACSREEPYWYTWEKGKEDIWVRPMPECAVRDLKGFKKGMTMPEAFHLPYLEERPKETIAMVRGLRAAESLRRARSVSMKEADNWIMKPQHRRFYGCSPIYDWSAIDVWRYQLESGCDFNPAYDLMDAAGLTPHQARVCPPYGEEPLGNLWIYAVCWPEMWERMINRVPGAATAGRYSGTELYGYGGVQLPEGHTWQTWTFALLELWPQKWRARIARAIKSLMELHASKTTRPIPETEADPLTGVSWKTMAMLVARGDLKDRRSGNVINAAIMQRDKRGITLEEAMQDATDVGTRY